MPKHDHLFLHLNGCFSPKAAAHLVVRWEGGTGPMRSVEVGIIFSICLRGRLWGLRLRLLSIALLSILLFFPIYAGLHPLLGPNWAACEVRSPKKTKP